MLAIACTLPSTGAAQGTKLGFDTVRLEALRARMAQLVQDGKFHGLVTLIERHGKTVAFDAFGSRLVGGSDPMKTDTIFQIMSMTKPVAAVAVARLVEQGKVRWNDPISDYLPASSGLLLPDGKKPGNPIRIRNLLGHTAGINSDMPVEDSERASWTLAKFADFILKQPLRSEPGTEVRYAGPGTTLAGRIVEIVSGKPFEVFCQEEIFLPLKMADASFFLPAEKRPRLANVGLMSERGLRALDGDPARPGARFANPAGGMYATASDMAKFMRGMLAKRGGILSPATIRLMTTPGAMLPGSGDEQSFGLGFSVVRGPGPARSLLPAGSFGHSGAFETYMWADPENDIVGIFMAQRIGAVNREIELFRTMVYSALEK